MQRLLNQVPINNIISHSDRRVTVNNIQVILVYGRPGDRARWSVMTTGRLEPIKETGEETGEEKTEAPKEKCVVC